jgi:hypothetical protein
MKARLTVKIGAVRIFPNGTPVQIFGGEVHHPPYSIELTAPWAAGSGSSPLNAYTPGTFEVEAIEDGVLRVYREARDGQGNIIPSTDSTDLTMKTGQKASFNTHESNAATVTGMPSPPSASGGWNPGRRIPERISQ